MGRNVSCLVDLLHQALSIQAKDKNLVVIEDFNFDTPKTKNFIDVLKALELDTKKALFVGR